jgi:hypothetical protein
MPPAHVVTKAARQQRSGRRVLDTVFMPTVQGGGAGVAPRPEQLVQLRFPQLADLLQAYDGSVITVAVALLKNLPDSEFRVRPSGRAAGVTSFSRYSGSKYLRSHLTKVEGELNALDKTFHVTTRCLKPIEIIFACSGRGLV